MPLPDTIYCAQQVHIPPELPGILKAFTKAAIRTQPQDVLVWAEAYFTALANGEVPPVTERAESSLGPGLTPGLLKTLHKQLSTRKTCSKEELQMKWKSLCLPMQQLQELLFLGGFDSEVDWMEFFALGCSALGRSLLSSLKFACEILTDDEEGGAARIPFDTFVRLYTYLAHIDDDLTQANIDEFLTNLQPEINLQNGMIKVSNFYTESGMEERRKERKQE
ncbi:ropporin-1-like protein [Cololabis saira]|uniref:ropporin-1-like protein n=1 Tax=Cololabis saira TaxID=129043 RepID=UPI002AD56BD8|nr:ropporin-1-like protein [Cololabis saira]